MALESWLMYYTGLCTRELELYKWLWRQKGTDVSKIPRTECIVKLQGAEGTGEYAAKAAGPYVGSR